MAGGGKGEMRNSYLLDSYKFEKIWFSSLQLIQSPDQSHSSITYCQAPKGKNGKQNASWSPKLGKEKNPQSVKEILPRKYESISNNRYLVVKTIDDVSHAILEIFVHHKIVEVWQCDPRITLKQDGSLIVEVLSPDESDHLCAICDFPGAQGSCSPYETLNRCRTVFSRDLMRYSEKLLKKF